jgi:hypothetical protein
MIVLRATGKNMNMQGNMQWVIPSGRIWFCISIRIENWELVLLIGHLTLQQNETSLRVVHHPVD